MNKKLESGTEKNAAPTALASPIPPEVQELLGPPPLLSNEDARLYYAMLASLAQFMRPTNMITWLLVKDLVDHRVEIARYRRFKTAIVQGAGDHGASSTEANLVERTYRWIEKHERIENLLRAVEERFTATLDELDRHTRGMGRLIPEEGDIIEGELAVPDPSSSSRPTALNSRRGSNPQNASPQMIPSGESIARQRTRRVARGNR
jgi:hypothetical protein